MPAALTLSIQQIVRLPLYSIPFISLLLFSYNTTLFTLVARLSDYPVLAIVRLTGQDQKTNGRRVIANDNVRLTTSPTRVMFNIESSLAHTALSANDNLQHRRSYKVSFKYFLDVRRIEF